VGIAVNTRTCPRARALRLLAEAGLEPVDTTAYRGFEHRVDQAIVRDLVVAVKHRDRRPAQGRPQAPDTGLG
jgi:hypothetical protein